MKDLFPSYYNYLSEQDYEDLWKKGTFIFDTNVLLDFYEFHRETREIFFKALEIIKEKDRLWIPHQVLLEYQENRISRIIQANSKFDNTKKELDKITKDTEETLLKAFKSQCYPHEAVEEMIENVKKVFNVFGNKLTSYQEELIKMDKPDDIRDKISDLFQGKIGESFNQDELNEIYKEGATRYAKFQPPGFGDIGKDKKKNPSYLNEGLVYRKAYGDLIIWKQILKRVESKALDHIIFITSDNKEDWWEREHEKTIGPRRELTEEILAAGACKFHMYKADKFLEWARKTWGLDVKEESIQQVKIISESKETEKEKNQLNLPTASSTKYPCPICKEPASLLMYRGLRSGEPAIIYDLRCSNCGHRSFSAETECYAE